MNQGPVLQSAAPLEVPTCYSCLQSLLYLLLLTMLRSDRVVSLSNSAKPIIQKKEGRAHEEKARRDSQPNKREGENKQKLAKHSRPR